MIGRLAFCLSYWLLMSLPVRRLRAIAERECGAEAAWTLATTQVALKRHESVVIDINSKHLWVFLILDAYRRKHGTEQG